MNWVKRRQISGGVAQFGNVQCKTLFAVRTVPNDKKIFSQLSLYQDVLADVGPSKSGRGGGGEWWGEFPPPGWHRTGTGPGWRTSGRPPQSFHQILGGRTWSWPVPWEKLINGGRIRAWLYQFQNFQSHNNSSPWILHVQLLIWEGIEGNWLPEVVWPPSTSDI